MPSNAKTGGGWPLLRVAVSAPACFALILTRARGNPDFEADRDSALARAADLGVSHAVRALVEAGADPLATRYEGHSVPFLATVADRPDILRLLAGMGVDLLKTPLACRIIVDAAYFDSPKSLNFWLDLGASIDATDAKGWTGAHHAAREGHWERFLALANRGANLGAKNDEGQTCEDLARESRCGPWENIAQLAAAWRCARELAPCSPTPEVLAPARARL